MPLPMRALKTSESASKSFTFEILLSLSRSTTVVGFSLWEEMVPQLNPMADSTIGIKVPNRSHRKRTPLNLGSNMPLKMLIPNKVKDTLYLREEKEVGVSGVGG